MSFKREGDDHSLLENIRKRRLAELFAEKIPEDEAYLMSNGRYACLVCHHRPVFDTLTMMAMHRKGKRHLTELERFVDKKGELDALILKRQHAEYDKDGRVILDAKKVKSAGVLGPGLLPSATYSSRNKQKKKSVLFRRKMVVDLKARSAKAVANSRPLTSNANSRSTTARDMNPSKKSSVSNSAATCEQKLAAENSKSSEKDTVVYVHKQYRSASESLNSRRPHVDVAVADVHKRKQLEHYLHLKSCGWKKSNDGQWIKDELVEFDSDEDEPPTVDMISH